MKTITSRDNPTVKALKTLLTDARRRREAGFAVLEGPHLITAALDHAVRPNLVAVSESARSHPEITNLLDRLGEIDMLCLSDGLFRSLSELVAPLGILARIGVPCPEPSILPAGDCLLLDAVQDAGNVGALLRIAAAAGVHDVLLGPGCAGAWTSRVLRAAQGAHFHLRIREQANLAAFLHAYAGTSVAAVAHGGDDLYGLSLSGPTTWLFGNEGNGIAPELVRIAGLRATIPLAQGSESLNVAAAAAVCLFETRRQRKSVLAGRHREV